MRRVNALFKDNAELMALCDQADNLVVSQKLWDAVAPDSLKLFSRVGKIKSRCLTIYADNGAVAAKVKLLSSDLLTKLQMQGLEVTAIRVAVQVQSTPRKPPKIARNISPAAASSLSALAKELSGSALAEALFRLSRRS